MPGKLLLIILFTTALFSCSESPDPPSPVDPPTDSISNCKIRRVTYFSPNTNTSYAFDAGYTGNQLTSLTSSFMRVNLFYDAQNLLRRKEYYMLGNPQMIGSNTFVNDGFIAFNRAEIDSNYYDNELRPVGETALAYTIFDASVPLGAKRGFLSNYISNNDNYTFKRMDLTWEHDDPVIAKMTVHNTSDLAIDSIFYDTTRINKFNYTFREFHLQGVDNQCTFGLSQFLVYHYSSKHLITRVKAHGPTAFSNERIIGDITYTFNEDSLINEIRVNGQMMVRYDYNCN